MNKPRMQWIGRTELPSGNAAGGVASPGDISGASFGQMWFVENTTAANDSLVEAYENLRSDVKTATGVDLGNPMIAPFEASIVPNPLDMIGRQYGLGDVIAEQRLSFQQKLNDLAGQYPREAIRSWYDRDPVRDAEAIARAADDKLATLMESRPGWDKYVYAFGGAAGAAMRDPLTLGSLFLGGGPGGARTALGRVLQTAGTEAAINAGTEAAMQPWVQAWREQAGLDHGFDQAIQNIAFAAGLGGVFGVAAGGVREAVNFARLTPDQRATMPAELRGAIDAGNAMAALDAQRPADMSVARHEELLARAEAAARREAPPMPVALDEMQVARLVEALAPERTDAIPARPPEAFAETLQAIRAGDGATARTPRPVMEFIRSIGGVDPDGPMAQELAALGITNQDLPGLFKRGGSKDLDNVPLVEAQLAFPGRTDIDDGNGYVSRQSFVDALAAEKQRAASPASALAEERAYWEKHGVDFDRMDDAQILERMAHVSDAEARWQHAGPEARLEMDSLVRQALERSGGSAPDQVVRAAVDLHRMDGEDLGTALDWAMSDAAGVSRALPSTGMDLPVDPPPPRGLDDPSMFPDDDWDWTADIEAMREFADPSMIRAAEYMAEDAAINPRLAKLVEACPF
jgi:hypothetical protein